ncbi:MAG: hypothetical protein ACK4YU_00005, partial [Paracoccus sp. (in: a-proteobacteria)]
MAFPGSLAHRCRTLLAVVAMVALALFAASSLAQSSPAGGGLAAPADHQIDSVILTSHAVLTRSATALPDLTDPDPAPVAATPRAASARPAGSDARP